MKIIIMNGSSWYGNKIGKIFKVQAIGEDVYITADGAVLKTDAEVIEK